MDFDFEIESERRPANAASEPAVTITSWSTVYNTVTNTATITETQISVIETPGPTVTTETPGPTTTVITPGPTSIIETPGPTSYIVSTETSVSFPRDHGTIVPLAEHCHPVFLFGALLTRFLDRLSHQN
jgi:hypothetical protein